VTYWHPNGKIARQGHAQWLTGAKGARFYWFGPWTSYAEDGQKTAVNTYTDGKLTRAETYQDGQLIRVDTFDKLGQRTSTTNTL
jgi:antitoxin component YwqK of YwqJK toxin-antitoxin module